MFQATPLGASAKFAFGGKKSPRKDLVIAYGNVYVAQLSTGADTNRPSSPCAGPRPTPLRRRRWLFAVYCARTSDEAGGAAVASGHWPLFRFDPGMRQRGMNPFRLDSTRPRIPLEEYRANEVRFSR